MSKKALKHCFEINSEKKVFKPCSSFDICFHGHEMLDEYRMDVYFEYGGATFLNYHCKYDLLRLRSELNFRLSFVST